MFLVVCVGEVTSRRGTEYEAARMRPKAAARVRRQGVGWRPGWLVWGGQGDYHGLSRRCSAPCSNGDADSRRPSTPVKAPQGAPRTVKAGPGRALAGKRHGTGCSNHGQAVCSPMAAGEGRMEAGLAREQDAGAPAGAAGAASDGVPARQTLRASAWAGPAGPDPRREAEAEAATAPDGGHGAGAGRAGSSGRGSRARPGAGTGWHALARTPGPGRAAHARVGMLRAARAARAGLAVWRFGGLAASLNG